MASCLPGASLDALFGSASCMSSGPCVASPSRNVTSSLDCSPVYFGTSLPFRLCSLALVRHIVRFANQLISTLHRAEAEMARDWREDLGTVLGRWLWKRGKKREEDKAREKEREWQQLLSQVRGCSGTLLRLQKCLNRQLQVKKGGISLQRAETCCDFCWEKLPGPCNPSCVTQLQGCSLCKTQCSAL